MTIFAKTRQLSISFDNSCTFRLNQIPSLSQQIERILSEKNPVEYFSRSLELLEADLRPDKGLLGGAFNFLLKYILTGIQTPENDSLP